MRLKLPQFPSADARGNFPAIEYARASIARDIVRRRRKFGLSRDDLARLARVRLSTLDAVESCDRRVRAAAMIKIDRALSRAS